MTIGVSYFLLKISHIHLIPWFFCLHIHIQRAYVILFVKKKEEKLKSSSIFMHTLFTLTRNEKKNNTEKTRKKGRKTNKSNDGYTFLHFHLHPMFCYHILFMFATCIPFLSFFFFFNKYAPTRITQNTAMRWSSWLQRCERLDSTQLALER